MRYVQPLGISDVNASYIDGNPALGIEGSVFPAAAAEHPMREIVHVIKEAGLEPSGQDLTQLFQAIIAIVEGYVPEALPAFPIGYPGLMPWEVDELDTEAPGWYPATGLRFPLDSHPGQALFGLSTKYKTNWGVTVTDVGGVLHINTPNYYHIDGRGLFMRPGTLVGSVRDDTMRPITGDFEMGNPSFLVPIRNAGGAFSASQGTLGFMTTNPISSTGVMRKKREYAMVIRVDFKRKKLLTPDDGKNCPNCAEYHLGNLPKRICLECTRFGYTSGQTDNWRAVEIKT